MTFVGICSHCYSPCYYKQDEDGLTLHQSCWCKYSKIKRGHLGTGLISTFIHGFFIGFCVLGWYLCNNFQFLLLLAFIETIHTFVIIYSILETKESNVNGYRYRITNQELRRV